LNTLSYAIFLLKTTEGHEIFIGVCFTFLAHLGLNYVLSADLLACHQCLNHTAHLREEERKVDCQQVEVIDIVIFRWKNWNMIKYILIVMIFP